MSAPSISPVSTPTDDGDREDLGSGLAQELLRSNSQGWLVGKEEKDARMEAYTHHSST